MKPVFVVLHHRILPVLIFLVSSVACGQTIKKDEFDIIPASFFYPQKPKLHKIKVAVLLLKYKFPEPWLEGAYHVPFLNVQSSMGLHKNFTAHLGLGTIVVSNQLSAGLRWNRQIDDKFSFNTGYELGTVFGGLFQSGYDTRISAIIHYPSVAFGYRYRDIVFTLKGELSVVGRVKIRTGENVLSDEENFYNGFSISLYMEQRLWKDHILILGLKNHYTKLNYIAWPAFSTFNRFYNVPELSFGLVL